MRTETVVTKSRDTTTDRLRSSDVSGSALKFFKFMQLPKELRLLIWREAIANEEYTRPDGITLRYLSSTIDIRDYVKIADDPLIPKFLPRICDVSEETREETIAVLIEGSKFMIASLRDNTFLQTFFKPKGMTGRLELCRDLSFDFFSRFPNGYEKNADLELAVACTSLKTIKLTFHHEPLTRYVLEGDYDEGLTRYPRSADQVFEQFKLRRLLDGKCLKTIIIEHTSYYIPAAVEAAEKLGDLLKLKFSQLEPSQDVAVCYGRQAPRPRRRYPYH
jgi:hypothetical protein